MKGGRACQPRLLHRKWCSSDEHTSLSRPRTWLSAERLHPALGGSVRKPTIRMWPRVYLVESCRHETTGGTHRAISQVGTTNVLVGALRLLQRSKSSSNTSGEWMEGGSCSKLTSSSQSTKSTAPVTACTVYNSITNNPNQDASMKKSDL